MVSGGSSRTVLGGSSDISLTCPVGVWVSVVVVAESADDVVVFESRVGVFGVSRHVINGWCYACGGQGGRIVVSLSFGSPPTVFPIWVWEGVMGSHVDWYNR